MSSPCESGDPAPYQAAAEALAAGIGADRSAVFCLDAEGRLVMNGVVGVSENALVACPFSVPTVAAVIEGNRNLLYTNAPEDARENTSLRHSGAISMLCVPFYAPGDKAVGALYADTTRKPRAFHRKELLFARDCATWLESRLAGKDDVAKPEIVPVKVPGLPATVNVAPAQPGAVYADRTPPRSPEPTRRKSDLQVPSNQLMVFFRSLASLTRAGVHIDTSLRLLGQSSEDKSMREVSTGLSDSVFRGEPVSTGMDRYPDTFSQQVRATVRTGERTGRLVYVLEVLATDLEKGQRLRYRMRSALTYPAFLGAACGLMLVFGPPYLLQGHLRLLADSGIPLPLSTRLLLLVSKAMTTPLFLLALGVTITLLLGYVRSKAGSRKAFLLACRAPVIGRILALLSLTELARSLAVQTKAGMTAMEALAQARQGCQDPEMAEAIRRAEEGVRNGDSLAEAMGHSKVFSATFLSFIEAGEQTGTLVRLTEWLADFYEQELEAGLSSFVSLAEPVIMAVMGMVAAFLLVATIKPTILILQAI